MTKVLTNARHRAGLTSLGCLGHIAAMGLLIVGCQGVYVALKNRDPLEITVTDYIAQKPNAEWLLLKDAQVSITEAAYKERLGDISQIFLPVRPAENPRMHRFTSCCPLKIKLSRTR